MNSRAQSANSRRKPCVHGCIRRSMVVRANVGRRQLRRYSENRAQIMFRCLFLMVVLSAHAALDAAPALDPSSRESVQRVAETERVDRARLVDGVREIAAPGVPGPLVVAGLDAFVVAYGPFDDDGIQAPVVAAARWEKGRVIAFGHSGYLDAANWDIADTGRLLANGIAWASAGRAEIAQRGSENAANDRLRVGLIHDRGLADALNSRGFDAQSLECADLIKRIASFDVICLGQSDLDEQAMRSIAAYVRSGGGLIMAGLGWGWLQLRPGLSLEEHPGNRLLNDVGIAWADGTLDRSSARGFSVGAEVPRDCHAMDAMRSLEESAGASSAATMIDDRQASSTALLAVRTLPASDKMLLPRIRRLASEHRRNLVPSASKPLTADRHSLMRVLLAQEIVESNRSDASHVKAQPAAVEFPGLVSRAAPRVNKSIKVNLSAPGRQSTGLYAAPGELIRVRFAPASISDRLTMRIGAHSDELFHKREWKRAPWICRRFDLKRAESQFANAFGGLIYFECPGDGNGVVEVEVSGAVEAPLFVLGTTDGNEWTDSIRHRPAPWAELASSKIIVTVPSEAVRGLDDPAELMRFWDRIADAHASLAAMPLERRRPERFVADVQISAGYMHAGYPIMTHLDAVDSMTRVELLRRGPWGLLHELGHNHQSSDWTFDGTGEVTCNLFALHAIDTICAPLSASRGHDAVDRPPSFAAYASRGAKFDEWKRDPFLALQMYVQLERAFGWETFKRVFAEYRALPASERPKNDAEKRDQWMMRFSRATGKNLSAFFDAWGVPISDGAREAVAAWPIWVPEEVVLNEKANRKSAD